MSVVWAWLCVYSAAEKSLCISCGGTLVNAEMMYDITKKPSGLATAGYGYAAMNGTELAGSMIAAKVGMPSSVLQPSYGGIQHPDAVVAMHMSAPWKNVQPAVATAFAYIGATNSRAAGVNPAAY